MHELMHGLGPHNITVAGRATTVRQELKETYSAIEEAKADISGLFALQYLVDKGVLDASMERTMYTTFLASAFRSIRFGINEAHGRGIAIQLNTLLDAGAFTVAADGTFAVDPAKIKAAVTALTREIMTLQAAGDYAAAKAMIATLGGRAARGEARARQARPRAGRHRAAVRHGGAAGQESRPASRGPPAPRAGAVPPAAASSAKPQPRRPAFWQPAAAGRRRHRARALGDPAPTAKAENCFSTRSLRHAGQTGVTPFAHQHLEPSSRSRRSVYSKSGMTGSIAHGVARPDRAAT